jgi:hypothetical protein
MKIKLGKALDLLVEVSGSEKTKGLLNEKISFSTKWHLNKLSKELQSEQKSFMEARDESVKKNGEETENGPVLKLKLEDGSVNPNALLFSEEINDLLNQDVEIRDYEFTLESISFESDSNYPLFNELFIKVND